MLKQNVYQIVNIIEQISSTKIKLISTKNNKHIFHLELPAPEIIIDYFLYGIYLPVKHFQELSKLTLIEIKQDLIDPIKPVGAYLEGYYKNGSTAGYIHGYSREELKNQCHQKYGFSHFIEYIKEYPVYKSLIDITLMLWWKWVSSTGEIKIRGFHPQIIFDKKAGYWRQPATNNPKDWRSGYIVEEKVIPLTHTFSKFCFYHCI